MCVGVYVGVCGCLFMSEYEMVCLCLNVSVCVCVVVGQCGNLYDSY